MALGNVTGILERESSFSEVVRDALTKCPMGKTVAIAWAVPSEVSGKLVPLASASEEYGAILLAHREKTLINGVKVQLTDAEQTDLFNARTVLDNERIDIVRKAMNSERNTHASAAKAFADSKLPNTLIKVGTATNVDPTKCRFTFTPYRKLTRVESADAIANRFRKVEPAKS